MGKHYYKNFELNMDISAINIANALNSMREDYKGYSEDSVGWNPLGTYVFYNDGGLCTYYFTKKYLNVSGWDLHDACEINKCFDYLRKCE
jgi:hypothetical protein